MTGPTTAGALVRWGASILPCSPTAMLDSRTLFLHVSGMSHADLIAAEDATVHFHIVDMFKTALTRRAADEPVALITGQQEFYGRAFRVTGDTLIPRPETEMLVDAALGAGRDGDAVLDLGTGSGCLLLSLLAVWPASRGVGVDISGAALAIAARNAAALGVSRRTAFLEADFADAPARPFGVIVANPPYIATGAKLPPSVARFEPPGALFAGADGLDAYRVLGPVIAARLAPHGSAFLEIGTGQGEAVGALMSEANPSRTVSVSKDMSGHERMVTIAP